MNHHTDHQRLTLRVCDRSRFDEPQPGMSGHARGPGVAISVLLHVAFLIAVLALSHTAARRTPPHQRTSLTFAPVSLAAPAAAVRAPRTEPEPLARRIKPASPPLRPADDAAQRVERPAPAPIPEAVHAEVIEPPPDIIAPSTPSTPEPAVRVGAFESTPARRQGTRETGAVVAAGFGDASARGTGRIVPTANVASGGFDRQTAPPPPVSAPAAAESVFADSSIEILFKPKPRYTDEAEALGIQGTVVLEVEFTASNDVRVLRVIRTLGHGLDEAAIRAAEQIRFKPARRQGVAVDSRVTVQIEFRLS